MLRKFTTDGDELKFVDDLGWVNDRTGEFVAENHPIPLEHNGSNIIVPAGTYDVYLNANASITYFMTSGEKPAN